ncbi:MAG: hypothetical protein WCG47_33725, partial [Dermatophilaceae bacterium]
VNIPRRPGGPAGSADDEFVLAVGAAVAVAALVGSVGVLWLAGVDWLLERGVLVSAAASPVMQVPGCAGAGLDGPLLAVAAGLVLAVAAWVGSAIWRRVATGRVLQ